MRPYSSLELLTYGQEEALTYAQLEVGPDRQVGSVGLQADIQSGQRQVAGLDIQVDLAPPQTFERQTGGLALNVDFIYPKGVQFGGLELNLDLVPSSARWLAGFGLQVDLVPQLLPVVTWSAGVFQIGGSAPAVQWQAVGGVFQTSHPELPDVLWPNDGTFHLEP